MTPAAGKLYFNCPPAKSADMNELAGQSVVIVGSGVGGLSTACYLASEGADVTVLERNEQLGGRMSRLYRDGFTFDMGPSWYLMPDVFERFFNHFDRSPEEFYELTHLDPHYTVYFEDGDRIEITPDLDKTRGLFEAYEDGAGEALAAYLEESAHTYDIGMEEFVYTDRSRLRDWIDPALIRARDLTLRGSMQEHVESYFDHPKLQQLMQYTLIFLGGSPTNTPALYNLMSHVDFNLGVWYPEGGIGTVVDALVTLGHELGVDYRVNCEVTEIRGQRGGFLLDVRRPDHNGPSAITDAPSDAPPQISLPADGPPTSTPVTTMPMADGGAEHAGVTADLVVGNANLAHIDQDLLPPEKRAYGADYWESRTYAPSAYMLYLGVEGELPDIDHHTLLLPADWNDHFDAIFESPAWPDDPSLYLCVPSKTDPSVAPDGHHAVVVLVPVAPGLSDSAAERNAFRDQILEGITAYTDVDFRDRIVTEESFSVSGFTERYHSYAGSALGMAHTLMQTAVFRPSHRYPGVDGLYAVGASTNPGIGVPMGLISGEIVADKMLNDAA